MAVQVKGVMKIKTPKKQSWKTILAVAITGAVSGMLGSNAFAEPLVLENHSFEEDPDGNVIPENGALFSLDIVSGWPRYFSAGDESHFVFGEQSDFVNETPVDFTSGSIRINADNNNNGGSFIDSAPDENRVLLLVTTADWSQAVDDALEDEVNPISAEDIAPTNGRVELGVEQFVGWLEVNTTYTLRVDVGNIETTNPEFFPVFGFPGYRVQLVAKYIQDGESLEEVIAEDANELEIGEGEFVLSDFKVRIDPGHPLIGANLFIRLINMNLENDSDPDDNNLEVNFDNVRLDIDHALVDSDIGPIASDLSWIDPDSDSGGANIERFFSITGKGEKRLLLTARGPSLLTKMVDLIQDPTVVVLDEKGKVVARSDDWAKERDASEIGKVLGPEKTHRKDGGVIVELPAGNYSVVVQSNGKKGGYVTSEYYDLDPNSTASWKLAGKSETELRKLWK